MDLRRRNPAAYQGLLRDQSGFVYAFFISFLPLLLAGFLVVLCSQFFLKNWMQSLHICRTELLSSQKKAGQKLQELVNLNQKVQSLRLALKEAQIRHDAAIASENYVLAAETELEIQRIQIQQQLLDRTQKALIYSADLEMSSGVQRVVLKLRRQNQELQPKLPDFFSFQIKSIQGQTQKLAVQPDSPGVAPVYELKPSFKDEQALHVSWTSEFQTKSPEKYRWIINHHKKQDGCSASLEEDSDRFRDLLIEGKSSLRL